MSNYVELSVDTPPGQQNIDTFISVDSIMSFYSDGTGTHMVPSDGATYIVTQTLDQVKTSFRMAGCTLIEKPS
jgi:hypothetical protein